MIFRLPRPSDLVLYRTYYMFVRRMRCANERATGEPLRRFAILVIMQGRRLLLWTLYGSVLWCWHLLLQATWTVPSPPLPTSGANDVAASRVEQIRPESIAVAELSPPPSPVPSPSPPPPPRTWPAETCQGSVHTEYDGAVMVPGTGPGATVSKSPADCCALCARTRGCNTWVACTHPWCGTQCWLKWTEDPTRPTVRAKGGETPWTSGTVSYTHLTLPTILLV